MVISETDPESLTTSIKRAFHDKGVPPHVEKVLKSTHQHGPLADEYAQVYLQLDVGSWENVPITALHAFFPSCLIVEGEVLQYFLPAFMIAALSEGCSYEFVLALVNKICLNSSRDGPQIIGVSISDMTAEQLHCLFGFLKWCRDNCFMGKASIQRRIDRGLQEISRNKPRAG